MLLLAHAASTWMLAGLIWTIQIVQYPLFESVGADRFAEYHRPHMLRISLIVVPLMLAEAVTGGWLLLLHRSQRMLWIGTALIVFLWVSTALIHAPLHVRLEAGLDPSAIRRLTRANWLRTTAWTIRAFLVMGLIHQG
jgi:hypothetical protein